MHNKNQVANEYEVKSYLRSNGWKSPITKIYSKVVITSRAIFNERASKQASKQPRALHGAHTKALFEIFAVGYEINSKTKYIPFVTPRDHFRPLNHISRRSRTASVCVCVCVSNVARRDSSVNYSTTKLFKLQSPREKYFTLKLHFGVNNTQHFRARKLY